MSRFIFVSIMNGLTRAVASAWQAPYQHVAQASSASFVLWRQVHDANEGHARCRWYRFEQPGEHGQTARGRAKLTSGYLRPLLGAIVF
jgi:hypothetical protein